MGLREDITGLRDRTLQELVRAHDYFNDSVFAWEFMAQSVTAGSVFIVQNPVTGTSSTQTEVAGRARDYVAKQLTQATFQAFIGVFEAFLFDFLRLWLAAYPQALSDRKVEFKAILAAADKDALVHDTINRELNEVLYERPSGWFADLETKLKLGLPAADEIDRFAEAKASRDVWVHNGGVNRAYLAKAGRFARYRLGEWLDLPEPYHRGFWALTCKLVGDIGDGALTKLP